MFSTGYFTVLEILSAGISPISEPDNLLDAFAKPAVLSGVVLVTMEGSMLIRVRRFLQWS